MTMRAAAVFASALLAVFGFATLTYGQETPGFKAFSKNDEFQVYSRSYLTVIKQADFTTIMPDKPPFPVNIKRSVTGLSQFQAGPIYDFASVQIQDRPDGVRARNKDINRQQFAGEKQPIDIPEGDPGFSLSGECLATGFTGQNDDEIASHSCLLDLCLGGGGFNCLALYCGTSFRFFPTSNNPSNTVKNSPKLPPNYPCTIFGGTNSFFGARGTVDVFTITGSTTPNFATQTGLITQQLNVISNVPLPPAP